MNIDRDLLGGWALHCYLTSPGSAAFVSRYGSEPSPVHLPPASGITRAAHAGEYLSAFREIPVAEGRANHVAARSPRAAPKHLVGVAEEHLRVLGVGEWAKSRVGEEVRGRPLPDIAEHLCRAAVCGAIRVARESAPEGELVEIGAGAVGTLGRRLPLGLRRQALTGPVREGLGLVP